MLLYVFLCCVALMPAFADNTCLVTFDPESSSASLVLDWVPRAEDLRGNPGEHGAPGPPGPEGMRGPAGVPGMKGEMPTDVIAAYNGKIQRLKEMIETLQEGWVTAGNQYKYLVSKNLVSWEEGKALCESKGAKLATLGIRDVRVRNFLASYVLPRRAWIGLTDVEREGRWLWHDGVSSTRGNTMWGDGQPNNWNGEQDCAALDLGSNGIDDNSCDIKNQVLCEKEPLHFI